VLRKAIFFYPQTIPKVSNKKKIVYKILIKNGGQMKEEDIEKDFEKDELAAEIRGILCNSPYPDCENGPECPLETNGCAAFDIYKIFKQLISAHYVTKETYELMTIFSKEMLDENTKYLKMEDEFNKLSAKIMKLKEIYISKKKVARVIVPQLKKNV
jgi:hypothetical protein